MNRIQRLADLLNAGPHPAYDPETITNKYYVSELYDERGQVEVNEWAGLLYCVGLATEFADFDEQQDFCLESVDGEVYLTNIKGYSLMLGVLAAQNYFGFSEEQADAIFNAEWDEARRMVNALVEVAA